MNQLNIHDITSIKVTLPEAKTTDFSDIGEGETKWSVRELQIKTKEGLFTIRLFGDTIEDIKMNMEL